MHEAVIHLQLKCLCLKKSVTNLLFSFLWATMETLERTRGNFLVHSLKPFNVCVSFVSVGLCSSFISVVVCV